MSTNISPNPTGSSETPGHGATDVDPQDIGRIIAQQLETDGVSAIAKLLADGIDIDLIYAARDTTTNTPENQNQDH